MAATEINVQMQQRRDTAAGWTSSGTVLLAGELGYETDTGYAKLGDGSTAWASLDYLPAAGKAKDGTESAPGISFASDTDTGIYRPGSNQFGIATAGVPRIVVANGKVGVGTTSPQTIAHIFANDPILRIQDSSTSASNAFAAIQLAESGANGTLDNYWQIALDGDAGTSSDHLTFRDKTSEVMRIDSSGRLLVNTTTVLETSSAAKLHIAHTSGALIALGRDDSAVADGNDIGKIAFYGNDGGSYEKVAQITCEADGSHASGDKPGRLVFSTTADNASSPSERIRITSSGQIGINRTSPNGLLHMQSPSGTASAFYIQTSATSDPSEINFGDNLGSATGYLHYVHSDDSMRFGTFLSERVRITSSGNVGIKTSSPVADLDVNGRIASVAGSAATPSLHCRTDTDTGINFPESDRIQFITNGSEAARIDSSGRLLVGTSSAFLSGNEKKLQMLHANGGAEIVLGRDDASVSSGNTIGAIQFVGNAGSYQIGAQISAIADGTHGDDDKPTRLTFSTTADGASSPTARMRISNNGVVSIAGAGTTVDNGYLTTSFADGIGNGEQFTITFAGASNNHRGQNIFQINYCNGTNNSSTLYAACFIINIKDTVKSGYNLSLSDFQSIYDVGNTVNDIGDLTFTANNTNGTCTIALPNKVGSGGNSANTTARVTIQRLTSGFSSAMAPTSGVSV
tara:strand:- start:9 stop:2069 length:2061 start_codon:yes stop_codon:yes gene_type:complete